LQSRLEYLDGLRGIAILLVLSFHAYARWPGLVPYGDTYKGFPLFQLGWLGVELFFLISGFVIFMTLDKINNFNTFIYKRWLRLFPAMFLASILIYLTSPFFIERPAGKPDLIDLLPGLTFIEPEWWSYILKTDISSLEGAFWSLYVEFKFYVVSGLIYYFLGRKYLVPSLFLLFIFSIMVYSFQANNDSEVLRCMIDISDNLSLKYFGWFCAGSMFYLYKQNNNETYFLMALGVVTLSSYITAPYFHAMIAAFLVSGLFALSLRLAIIQKILSNRLLIFFGFVSYPLYLIHENAMISMVIKLGVHLPELEPLFYPFLPVFILVIVSFFIASSFESKVKNLIMILNRKKISKLAN